MKELLVSLVLASSVLRVSNGHVNATLAFSHVSSSEVTVTARQTLPGNLVVLGRDELLAFHQSTVVMYLAVTPRKTIHLTELPTFTFAFPRSGMMPVVYFLSYRGPSGGSWEMPGDPARARAEGAIAILSFKPTGLPATLPAGKTQNFVLYYPSEGAA